MYIFATLQAHMAYTDSSFTHENLIPSNTKHTEKSELHETPAGHHKFFSCPSTGSVYFLKYTPCLYDFFIDRRRTRMHHLHLKNSSRHKPTKICPPISDPLPWAAPCFVSVQQEWELSNETCVQKDCAAKQNGTQIPADADTQVARSWTPTSHAPCRRLHSSSCPYRQGALCKYTCICVCSKQ